MKPRLFFYFFTFIACFSIEMKAQRRTIDVQSVNTVPCLFAALKNNPADSACAILCYNLLFMPKEGNPYQIKSMGVGQGIGDLKNKLSQLQAGDVMNFTNIMLKCPNEQVNRTLENRSFVLK